MSDGSKEGFVNRAVALTDSKTDGSQPDVREGLMISVRQLNTDGQGGEEEGKKLSPLMGIFLGLH